MVVSPFMVEQINFGAAQSAVIDADVVNDPIEEITRRRTWDLYPDIEWFVKYVDISGDIRPFRDLCSIDPDLLRVWYSVIGGDNMMPLVRRRQPGG